MGDRVGRERVKSFLRNDGTSQLAFIPELKWAQEYIQKLETLFPNIVSKGFLHSPDIIPMLAKVNVSENFETDVEGLFVAGESANIMGVAAAGISGAIAAEGAVK